MTTAIHPDGPDARPSGLIDSLFVLPDGKILTGGRAGDNGAFAVAARYAADGSVDGTFGQGGVASVFTGEDHYSGLRFTWMNDGSFDVTGLGDSKIFIGRFDVAGRVTALGLENWSDDRVFTQVYDFVVQPDGRVVGVGRTSTTREFLNWITTNDLWAARVEAVPTTPIEVAPLPAPTPGPTRDQAARLDTVDVGESSPEPAPEPTVERTVDADVVHPETVESADAPAATVTAKVSGKAVVKKGKFYEFKVTYASATPIELGSLSGDDLIAAGPAGFADEALLVKIKAKKDKTQTTVTYRVAAPGGAFDAADNGRYSLRLSPIAVMDVDGGCTGQERDVGGFEVSSRVAPPGAPRLSKNRPGVRATVAKELLSEVAIAS